MNAIRMRVIKYLVARFHICFTGCLFYSTLLTELCGFSFTLRVTIYGSPLPGIIWTWTFPPMRWVGTSWHPTAKARSLTSIASKRGLAIGWDALAPFATFWTPVHTYHSFIALIDHDICMWSVHAVVDLPVGKICQVDPHLRSSSFYSSQPQ